MSRRRTLLWAGLILLVALGLRLRHAGSREGVWRDEAQAIYLVHESRSVGEICRKLAVEGHPPLPYLLDYQVQRWWGIDHHRLRRVPILFGLLTVAGVILLGWHVFGPRTGLFAGLFAATSPFFIYYSAELRSYALFGLLCVAHAFAYLRYLCRRTYASAVLWGVATAALLYTHYYGLYVAGGAGLYALLRYRTRPNLARLVVAGGTAVALFAPWIPTFLEQLSHDLQPWWVPRRKVAGVAQVFYAPLGKWGALLILGGLIYGAIHLRRIRAPRWRVRAFWALLCASAGSATLAWLAQFVRGPYWPRYLIGMAATLLPIACFAYAGLLCRERGARARVLGVLFIVTAIAFQYTDKARWLQKRNGAAAGVARQIEASGRAGDWVWISPAFFAPSFNYHYRGSLPLFSPPYRGRVTHVSWVDLPRRELDPDLLEGFLRDLEQHLEGGGRVWLVVDGYYPLSRAWAAANKRSAYFDPPLVRYEHQIHRRVLRTLYRYAEDLNLWDWPHTRYHENMTLVLFDPAMKR
ncbi:MAG: glycosyltransferase family 39 protein [Planctomycetota bacterium]|jgi:hypothetical protein